MIPSKKKNSKNKIPESNTKRDFSPLKREFSSPRSCGSQSVTCIENRQMSSWLPLTKHTSPVQSSMTVYIQWTVMYKQLCRHLKIIPKPIQNFSLLCGLNRASICLNMSLKIWLGWSWEGSIQAAWVLTLYGV